MIRRSVFVSHSSREDHGELFIDALEQVLGEAYAIDRTPSILRAAESQFAQIMEAIARCCCGVVLLDGLRPNVVFEYGVLVGMKRPVMVFLERDANIDVRSLYLPNPEPRVENVPVSLDVHFSDVKDQFVIRWNKFDAKSTRLVIREHFERKRGEIERVAAELDRSR